MPQSEPPLPDRADQRSETSPESLQQLPGHAALVGSGVPRAVVLPGPHRSGIRRQHLAQALEPRALPAAAGMIGVDHLESGAERFQLGPRKAVDARVGDDDHPVALEGSDPGEPLGHGAGGALDDHAAGTELSCGLAPLDDLESHPVLHGSRQRQLELRPQTCPRRRHGPPAEGHEGGISHQVQHRARFLHQSPPPRSRGSTACSSRLPASSICRRRAAVRAARSRRSASSRASWPRTAAGAGPPP